MRQINKKPRYALWENVYGAFSSSDGNDFHRVLEEFCQIKDIDINIPKLDKWSTNGEIVGNDFSLAWRTFDAQYWGVAQRRRRIYLVADFDGQDAGKIMFRNEGESFHTRQRNWSKFIRTSNANTGKEIVNEFNNIKFEDEKLNLNDIKGKFAKLDLSVGKWDFSVPSGYIIGEKPFYENTIKLSEILQHDVDLKYYLSSTACQGILRRALERGKTLPKVLQLALENQINNDFKDIQNNIKSLRVGATCRLNEKMSDDISGTLMTSGGDNQMSIIGTNSSTFRKQSHAKNKLDGQGWEEADVNDTLNIFDQGEGRTPTLVVDKKAESKYNPIITIEQHSVAYGISSKDSNGMKSDNPNVGYYKADTSRTLDLNGGNPACNQGGIAIVDYQNDKTEESNYYVRRLTPIECERLQNMPDNWCYDVSNDSLSQEDINFWDNVFEVYRKVISKGKKQKTKKQIETWIKSPLNDNSIYKIQGNGIALPNAWFVLEGIAKENK